MKNELLDVLCPHCAAEAKSVTNPTSSVNHDKHQIEFTCGHVALYVAMGDMFAPVYNKELVPCPDKVIRHA